MTSWNETAELEESSRSWTVTDAIPIILRQQQQNS